MTYMYAYVCVHTLALKSNQLCGKQSKTEWNNDFKTLIIVTLTTSHTKNSHYSMPSSSSNLSSHGNPISA